MSIQADVPSRMSRKVGIRAWLCVAFTSGVTLLAAVPAAARTVWLCRPGQRPDPCTPGLSTTVYSATLKRIRVTEPRPVKDPGVDCFYVYPTVSDQHTPNANLHIDSVQRSIALYQAARYSQYCRVFAPMYRQVTLAALFSRRMLTLAQLALPLRDVRSAFQTYLARYNYGRGFLFVGHSQGSFVLRALIAHDIDPKRAVRRRLVSAILLGGNVLVEKGKDVGGDFRHIPACRSARELGCVIAFSTFDGPVPRNSLFGRTSASAMAVLCTNPAALTGGSGLVDPVFPSEPFAPKSTLALGIRQLHITQPTPSTVWSSVPGAFRAQCSSASGANVLQVTPLHNAQRPTPSPDATWGLHLLDANIALGNLIRIVSSQAAAYAHRAV